MAERTFEQLMADIDKLFSVDRVNIEEVKELLASYNSNPKDWKKYALFDPHRYTRNLIVGNKNYNLIALCWGESQGSSIHDHSGSHCFVKMLQGTLRETLFPIPGQSDGERPLEAKSSTDYSKDGVTYIHDNMGVLHRMENPSHTERTVSMHLYSPPFNFCNSYDDNTGHTKQVEVTFWSKDGTRTDAGSNMLGEAKPTADGKSCGSCSCDN